MALDAGTKLGTFEIKRPIGSGGMGDVYLAHDSSLERDVAIKVLPDEYAGHPDRLSRFRREARLAASLDHTNIATIHGAEEVDGVHFIVMQFVDGPTLAEQLSSGPLRLEVALDVFGQIAAALEAAHDQGIVHRDLKPANIKITPAGQVKILDFGLAKAFSPNFSESDSEAPTLPIESDRSHTTQEGVILGTPAYMSPEQARGEPVDKRTDIWSFGCCFYEALTGSRPFKGRSSSDLLADILRGEPDWEALPPSTPPRIRELLRRCLEKDIHKRMRDIGDGLFQISEAASEAGSSASGIRPAQPLAPQRKVSPLLIGVAGLALGVAVTFFILRNGQPTRDQADSISGSTAPSTLSASSIDKPEYEPPRFIPIAIPESYQATFGAISPDGGTLAYTYGQFGTSRLVIRDLVSTKERIVVGSDGAVDIYFSPDGRSVVFATFPQGSFRRVSVAGGDAQLIKSVPVPLGSTWTTDGKFIFSDSIGGGLKQMPIQGGAVEQLTTADTQNGELDHRFPHALADGKHVVFTVWGGSMAASSIALLSRDTGQYETLVEGTSCARWAPSGHLVYPVAGNLVARSFDPEFPRRLGDPVKVVSNVRHVTPAGFWYYSISAHGDLIYVPGEESFIGGRPIWVSREGDVEDLPVDLFQNFVYIFPSVSPDGKKILSQVMSGDSGSHIWVFDLESKTRTRLTFRGGSFFPIWSHDGEHVYYISDSDPVSGLGTGRKIYRVKADGSGRPERLDSGEIDVVRTASISPDGQWLIYARAPEERALAELDLWMLKLDGSEESRPLIEGPSLYADAKISPDGKWIAYTSDETGETNVYVTGFPAAKGKWEISSAGGDDPAWAPAGDKIYFRNDNAIFEVRVETEPSFRNYPPNRVLRSVDIAGNAATLDVAPDGRFLLVRSATRKDDAPFKLIMVEGFTRLLNKVAPPE